LAEHQLIAYGESARAPFSEIDWVLKLGKRKKMQLRADFKVNSLFGMLCATEQGMGIAGLPDYMVRGAQNISPVLPNINGPAVDAYFVYGTELRNSKRITVFRDFLLRKFASTEF